MYIPRVKICCISSSKEAEIAFQYGVNAIGLVSEMPSGPGVINEAVIKKIANNTPPGIDSFLLTSRTDIDSIIEQEKSCQCTVIQIVDRINSGCYSDLKSAFPMVKIVQVIHVNDSESIDEAKSVASHVDAILLDSGNQNLPKKELGGTGRTHNWTISKQIREVIAPTPLFLAGGLNSINIKEALNTVRPYGVDLCSSVRTDGQLDEKKLDVFMRKIREFVTESNIN